MFSLTPYLILHEDHCPPPSETINLAGTTHLELFLPQILPALHNSWPHFHTDMFPGRKWKM